MAHTERDAYVEWMGMIHYVGSDGTARVTPTCVAGEPLAIACDVANDVSYRHGIPTSVRAWLDCQVALGGPLAVTVAVVEFAATPEAVTALNERLAGRMSVASFVDLVERWRRTIEHVPSQ